MFYVFPYLFNSRSDLMGELPDLFDAFTFSNPMLEPLRERPSYTCEPDIRGGPTE